jgi:hypothetical protein
MYSRQYQTSTYRISKIGKHTIAFLSKLRSRVHVPTLSKSLVAHILISFLRYFPLPTAAQYQPAFLMPPSKATELWGAESPRATSVSVRETNPSYDVDRRSDEGISCVAAGGDSGCREADDGGRNCRWVMSSVWVEESI